jgi:hypothetical protein
MAAPSGPFSEYAPTAAGIKPNSSPQSNWSSHFADVIDERVVDQRANDSVVIVLIGRDLERDAASYGDFDRVPVVNSIVLAVD